MGFFADATPTRYADTLTTELDHILNEKYPANGIGAVALVTKKGEVIYQKAFGMANLELNVPMKPDMVFRIASLTKQFTACAILQLAGQDKLSIKDDIRKFIPGYPIKDDSVITIENLLTHTSGIHDYTNEDLTKDKKPEELVTIIESLPPDFPPGTQYRYSNSGYILLGYIIEKVSGQTYGQYLQDHIFKPAGMTSAWLNADSKVIPNRAAGYRRDNQNNVFINAPYINMVNPYAAGGLLMNVDDYLKWIVALNGGKLIKKETLETAYKGFKLPNGEITSYGFGWEVRELAGSTIAMHQGDIPGFLANVIYFPKEAVLAVIFTNCECRQGDPGIVIQKVAAAAIGKPFNFKKIMLDSAQMQSYIGIYSKQGSPDMNIAMENNQLFFYDPGGPIRFLYPYAQGRFFDDDGLNTVEFTATDGHLRQFKFVDLRRPAGNWVKTDKPVAVRKEIILTETELNKFIGKYQMGSWIVTISREDNHLRTPGFGIFPASPNRFYARVQDIWIDFVADGDGKIIKMISIQGGSKVGANKIK
jgi:CubicO group peptidase (beta-lactamase class C family)